MSWIDKTILRIPRKAWYAICYCMATVLAIYFLVLIYLVFFKG